MLLCARARPAVAIRAEAITRSQAVATDCIHYVCDLGREGWHWLSCRMPDGGRMRRATVVYRRWPNACGRCSRAPHTNRPPALGRRSRDLLARSVKNWRLLLLHTVARCTMCLETIAACSMRCCMRYSSRIRREDAYSTRRAIYLRSLDHEFMMYGICGVLDRVLA